MLLRKMFTRKWFFATLFVLAGTALCIRLGIWQLDRLAQRRVFNHQVESMRAMPALDLNQEQPADLSNMEWRPVKVQGTYDFEHQVALRNQYNGNQYGYHLITPLRFNGGVVLVDRGWIPADMNSKPSDWRQYDEAGTVNISGQLRLGQIKPRFGGVADTLPANGQKLEVWNNADITHIAAQMPYPVLPIYIQPNADPNDTQPPIPSQPTLDLTEGPHFGYAIQWFTFATILFVGYPFFLRKQETK
jgi:surfeit locus 1 family protein